ncbi:chitin synthase chs-2-like [Littorina saxatilis]|uniref:chitin synthase n=1 Tax=Littorina saxatilis TaxID=31220 RepID=A0AAN9BVB7_9CAEN
MGENVVLLPRKTPNGPAPRGLDNAAFQTDHKEKDPLTQKTEPFSTAYNQPSGLDFGVQNRWSSETWDGEGDGDNDSVMSQHNGQDSLDGGSIGKDSRMEDFQGEQELQTDKAWDVFEETAWENFAHADREFWYHVYVVCRIVLNIVLFVLVLGLSSVGSFAFLVIVYNMNAAVQNYTLPGGQVLKTAGDVIDVRWVWAAIMVTSSPYVFTLLSCVRTLCVKRTRALAWRPLLMAMCVETVHSLGLGVFVFVVAPSYDPLMVIVLSQAVTFVPALLKVVQVKNGELRFSWADFAVLLLVVANLALVVFRLNHGEVNLALTVATPVSLLCLSVEWWENFIPIKKEWKQQRRKEARVIRRTRNSYLKDKGKQKSFEKGSSLFRAKYAIRDCKTKIEAVCTLWKIFLNLALPLVLFASRGTPDCVSVMFFTSDGAASCSLWHLNLVSSGRGFCSGYLPFVVAAVAVVCSGAAFKAAKVACKIHSQKLCFALPLVLSAPVTFMVAALTYRYGFSVWDCSQLRWPVIAEDLSLASLLTEYIEEYWLPLVFAGIISVGLITRHAWTPSAVRVASTDKLFVRPLYCGVMFAQSLLLNRAVDDNDTSGHNVAAASKDTGDWTTRFEAKTSQADTEEVEKQMQHSSFPRIYACATMWHETAMEMTQLLKSLFRMDKDQFTRACMWKTFNVVDKDFYHYEAHIFFDDAFTKEDRKGKEYYFVNAFVKQFLAAVDEAARSIYPVNAAVPPPTKTDTPYGGRLTYALPGGNPLVVHLKNKDFIRHKKRWSQVMYMYYLLSYKLLLGEHNVYDKKQIADNTFLLALDGDVDFYPDAVQLLVDRMRRSKHVGAACGRIHPIGSGLMVWYQKFEYAVSHWLQKATEHMFGCVLCSPGCFSLFRGSALMEDNVLRRYTKVATTARHAVQYDMGEDRWLCTLLLQQGKRVEYAAAADALTFCPDDFGEFYKQRRRWTPSTMANILDLLSDWRHVTKVNGSISFLFIAYQAFLFVSSLLTPGTIFLLILGAINTAYPTLPLYGAMLLNLLPVIVFIILCFSASGDVQISYATILSTMYSLVMMVVLVGLLRQIAESGMCSVTAIFFVGVAGIFCLAALLHPQEMMNLFYGLLYFLSIPSMSMLLVFYAVANLNDVGWGTRDSNEASSGKKKSKIEQFQGGFKRMMSLGGGGDTGGGSGGEGGGGGGGVGGGDDDVTSEYTFSFGNLFRCICCPRQKESDSLVMERFDDMENALYELRKAMGGRKSDLDEQIDEEHETARTTRLTSPVRNGLPFGLGDGHRSNPLFDGDTVDADQKTEEDMDRLQRRFWYEDPKLDSGSRDLLDPEEKQFWNGLIKEYLTPLTLKNDPEYDHKQKKMQEDLKLLRNKAAMLFFLGNALFVTVIFILESVSEYTSGLTLRLPCDKGHAGQKIEPISVTFTVVFGILLLLQLVGMLMHRFSTLVHIVASTTIRKPKQGSETADYAMHRQNPFYELTWNIVEGAERGSDNDTVSQGTGNTSVLDDHSIGRETIGPSRTHINKLIERQRTRNQSMKRRDLYDILGEELRPVIDNLDKAVGREGGDVEGLKDDKAAGPSTSTAEAEGGKGGVKKSDLRPEKWQKVRAMKAVMALAQDPARRQLVRARTEKVQDKWKNLVTKVTVNTRPKTFMDVVNQARKVSVAKGGTGKTNRASGDKDQQEHGVAAPTVSFSMQNETSPGPPKPSTGATGADSALKKSGWGVVKAAKSSELDKTTDNQRKDIKPDGLRDSVPAATTKSFDTTQKDSKPDVQTTSKQSAVPRTFHSSQKDSSEGIMRSSQTPDNSHESKSSALRGSASSAVTKSLASPQEESKSSVLRGSASSAVTKSSASPQEESKSSILRGSASSAVTKSSASPQEESKSSILRGSASSAVTKNSASPQKESKSSALRGSASYAVTKSSASPQKESKSSVLRGSASSAVTKSSASPQEESKSSALRGSASSAVTKSSASPQKESKSSIQRASALSSATRSSHGAQKESSWGKLRPPSGPRMSRGSDVSKSEHVPLRPMAEVHTPGSGDVITEEASSPEESPASAEPGEEQEDAATRF